MWGQSQQLENGCGVGFQSPKVILTSFKMCSHPSNLTVLCSFLCKAFLPCPGKNNATPYPAVPTNSTFSFPCYSTFHTVLEFTFLSPASLWSTWVPGLCVILALGTQEELNEHLLTKSRLKVIQDTIQKLFHLNCLVCLGETKTNDNTCWENPSDKSYYWRRKLKTNQFSLSPYPE